MVLAQADAATQGEVENIMHARVRVPFGYFRSIQVDTRLCFKELLQGINSTNPAHWQQSTGELSDADLKTLTAVLAS